jgi:hypothetical protein
MADDWGTVAQELERARSLAQRGTLLAGANTVTVAVLLQTMGVLVSPGMAAQVDAKFTLLVALLCFVVAAISGAITNSVGLAEASSGVLASALSAARQANATSARILNAGVGFDVVGMVFLALTAVLFVI